MAIRQIRPRNFFVTPKKAAAHAALPAVDGDRKPDAKKMKEYRDHVANGTFHSCKWGIIRCREDEVTYRVNGQNTSITLSDVDLAHKYEDNYGIINVTYTMWECDSLSEMSNIYSYYDGRGIARNATDYNRAVAVHMSSLDGAAAVNVNACASGVSFAMYGPLHHTKQSIEERAQELKAHDDYCGLIRELLESKELYGKISAFRKNGIFAAIWLTFREDEGAARVFWGRVFKGLGNTKTDERQLNKYFNGTLLKDVNQGRGTGMERNEFLLNKCLIRYDAWWKAFRRSDTIAQRKKVSTRRKQLRNARLTLVAKKNA